MRHLALLLAILLSWSPIAYCQQAMPVMGTTAPGGGGGGPTFTLVGSFGNNVACVSLGFPPAALTCPLDSGFIHTGNTVIVFMHDGANSTVVDNLSGGGAFSNFGFATMNFGSNGYIIGACAVASGTSSGVTVSSPAGFRISISGQVWSGGVNGCTHAGSPGLQASNYSLNGTAIDTGSAFNITTPSYVVGAIYGEAGALNAGAGWTSPSTSGGSCDGVNAFICTVWKLENSGTSTDPNGTQATPNVRGGIGIALN